MQVKVGDRIFVVENSAIVPAKVSKVYEHFSMVWWEPVSLASDGKKVTCKYRTSIYFLTLEEAKNAVLKALQDEKHKLLWEINAKISSVENYSFVESDAKNN